MLFDRDRLTSPVPSNWSENGPMSMRSPGFKRRRPGEPLAVDERAVGAAQVGEDDPLAFHGQAGVQPGDVRVVEVILDRPGVAADHAAARRARTARAWAEPRSKARCRTSAWTVCSKPAAAAGRRCGRLDRQDLDRRAGEAEPDPVAGPDGDRPVDGGVVQERLVVPAQVDQDEPLGRRLDPGMNPGHLREGDRIDRDLALRVPAEADGVAGHVEGLRSSVGLIHSDPNAHGQPSHRDAADRGRLYPSRHRHRTESLLSGDV